MPMNTLELIALEPGVWRLAGCADRDSVGAFFAQRPRLFDKAGGSGQRLVIDELEILDSAVLALLVHWRLDGGQVAAIDIQSPKLQKLIKLHRIESLFEAPSGAGAASEADQ